LLAYTLQNEGWQVALRLHDSATHADRREDIRLKLLGLSAGRKMGNSEVLLKEALLAAEETPGIKAEIVRLLDLNIKPCTGCGYCSRKAGSNEVGEYGCNIDDDMAFLRDKIIECDGMIASVPVFGLRPSGCYCIMTDRLPGFGVEFMSEVLKRKRIGAAIATGATDWVQFALPQMNLTFFQLNMKVIDHLPVQWAVGVGQVLLRDGLIARARKLGQNVATAMKKPVSEVEYMGDGPGTCPYCHSDLILIKEKKIVECPLCAIKGEMNIEGADLVVAWNDEDLKHLPWEGRRMVAHNRELNKAREESNRGKGITKEKLKRYEEYTPYSVP
jgi:multimeric flavodoxin WrbA